jgi:lactoylglutathione lyase
LEDFSSKEEKFEQWRYKILTREFLVMKFTMAHSSIAVKDVERSVEFYKKALGLKVKGNKDLPHIKLTYLVDGEDSGYELEITLRKDHEGEYNLGENPVHLAFWVDNYKEALAMHQAMGCVLRVVEPAGIYFIQDPDGYVTEIMPGL